MKKLASIYLRDGKLYVSASSRTKSGIWIGIGEIQVVNADDVEAISEAVRAALENSRHGLETPPPYEDLTVPLRDAAKVKSWGTFVNRAKHVVVSSSDGEATVTPYRKVTARGNYEALNEKKRACRVSSENFGATIVEALGDAT